MKVFVTGGTGVLGTALLPLLAEAGHDVVAPRHGDLDLFDPDALRRSVRGAEAVFHLATRIPPPDRDEVPGAWEENDRLRAEASRSLVDAALDAGTGVYVQPTVTFVYPPEGPVDESTPLGDVPPRLRSALVAESETARFTASGRRGVVLRLGLLYGPGTGSDTPDLRYGAVLHVEDAASALRAALDVPPGIYNVVADGGRVSNERFSRTSSWRPRH